MNLKTEVGSPSSASQFCLRQTLYDPWRPVRQTTMPDSKINIFIRFNCPITKEVDPESGSKQGVGPGVKPGVRFKEALRCAAYTD